MTNSELSFLGRILGTLGIAVTLVGAGLIYRFTIPFRLPTAPDYIAVEEDPPASEFAKDKRWSALSYLGLVLTVIGALMQMAGLWMA